MTLREEARNKEFLTLREAAVLFKKSVDTIHRWTRSAQDPLPVYRFPDTTTNFVKRADVIEYIAKHPTRRRSREW